MQSAEDTVVAYSGERPGGNRVLLTHLSQVVPADQAAGPPENCWAESLGVGGRGHPELGPG